MRHYVVTLAGALLSVWTATALCQNFTGERRDVLNSKPRQSTFAATKTAESTLETRFIGTWITTNNYRNTSAAASEHHVQLNADGTFIERDRHNKVTRQGRWKTIDTTLLYQLIGTEYWSAHGRYDFNDYPHRIVFDLDFGYKEFWRSL